jgi:hypothetical protein
MVQSRLEKENCENSMLGGIIREPLNHCSSKNDKQSKLGFFYLTSPIRIEKKEHEGRRNIVNYLHTNHKKSDKACYAAGLLVPSRCVYQHICT